MSTNWWEGESGKQQIEGTQLQIGFPIPEYIDGTKEIQLDQANPKDLIGVHKLSLTKIPDVALAHCAAAMMDGASKYGPYNWRTKAVRAEIYVDACRRHLAQWFDREETASDSGVHHLGHAMACLAILLDAQTCGAMIDDRPEMAGGFCLTLDSINTQIKESKSK